MAAIAERKLGPGSLKFGDTGSPQEFAADVTKVEVSPSWNDEDPIPALDGSEFYDEGTFEGTISGEFIQSYDLDSVTAWTWRNSGQEMPFTFRPRNDKAMILRGRCIIRAVTIGGDVKTANSASFEFKIAGGMPEMVEADTPGGE